MVSMQDLASGKPEAYRQILSEYGGIILGENPGLTEESQVQLLNRALGKLLWHALKRPEANAQRVVLRVLARSAGMSDNMFAQATPVPLSDELMEAVMARWTECSRKRGRRERMRSWLGGLSVALFVVIIIIATVLIYRAQLASGISP